MIISFSLRLVKLFLFFPSSIISLFLPNNHCNKKLPCPWSGPGLAERPAELPRRHPSQHLSKGSLAGDGPLKTLPPTRGEKTEEYLSWEKTWWIVNRIIWKKIKKIFFSAYSFFFICYHRQKTTVKSVVSIISQFEKNKATIMENPLITYKKEMKALCTNITNQFQHIEDNYQKNVRWEGFLSLFFSRNNMTHTFCLVHHNDRVLIFLLFSYRIYNSQKTNSASKETQWDLFLLLFHAQNRPFFSSAHATSTKHFFSSSLKLTRYCNSLIQPVAKPTFTMQDLFQSYQDIEVKLQALKKRSIDLINFSLTKMLEANNFIEYEGYEYVVRQEMMYQEEMENYISRVKMNLLYRYQSSFKL